MPVIIKKRIFGVSIILMCMLLSACAQNIDITPSDTNEEQSIAPSEEQVLALSDMQSTTTPTPLTQGKYYLVNKVEGSKYLYSIYNADNLLAFSEYTYWQPPRITEVSNDILEVQIGIGTGTWTSYYFNVVSSLRSPIYDCSWHVMGNIVAYMVNDGYEIKLIFEDAFDDDNYRFEIVRDFSRKTANIADNLTYIVAVDETHVMLQYLSGDDQAIAYDTVTVPNMLS